MFSDHLRRDIDELPRLNLPLVAAGLVIICQLVAMTFVVDGQVQKAGQRELEKIARQTAVAECVERNISPLRHGCIQQVQAAIDAARNVDDEIPALRPDALPGGEDVEFSRGSANAIPVKFATGN